jgi:superfamily II DNA or RNA helicase
MFLLGLTATPERTDGADLLALCDDNVVFEANLAEGIARGALVPFEYLGVPDTIDFEPIPWRNGKFDPTALEAVTLTRERAESALREWEQGAGDRTLAFCVSVRHAEFMADFFRHHIALRRAAPTAVLRGVDSQPHPAHVHAARPGLPWGAGHHRGGARSPAGR